VRGEAYLIHEKMENIPPLTREDVESPTGLLSTKLKVRKVRGVKVEREERTRESDR